MAATGAGADEPGIGDLLGELARWAAAERTAGAAALRRRTRSLTDQAASTSTWSGLLLELAERACEVTVTLPGTQLVGQLTALGRDFCVLEHRAGRAVLVASGAICSVARADGPVVPAGDRRPSLDLSLAGALDFLAADRTPVCVRTAGSNVEGTLISVGDDVITVRTPSPTRRLVHVPFVSLRTCQLR